MILAADLDRATTKNPRLEGWRDRLQAARWADEQLLVQRLPAGPHHYDRAWAEILAEYRKVIPATNDHAEAV